MRIRHTITFLDTQLAAVGASSVRAQLELLGRVSRGASLLNFVAYEDEETWPSVAALLVEYPAIDLAWTEFTGEELRAASWIELRPSWHHGYPMPDGDFGYLAGTYDLTNYCSTCGIGAVQNAAFRLRAEPRWGRRQVLQLNWVFDEFFVDPELYNTVFAPLNLASRPVLHHRTGNALRTIVQLVSSDDSTDVTLGDAPTQDCPICGRLKYLPPGRAVPQISAAGAGHLNRSRQFFGSGASARRLVIVSSALYRRLVDASVRGVSYAAVPQASAAQPRVAADRAAPGR